MIKRNILNTEVNNVHTQYYGGYKKYWELYTKLKQISRDMNIETNLLKQICDFIWLCLLKPLGCLYKHNKRYKGKFKVITDTYLDNTNYITFINESVVKSKTHYLFSIPFLYTSTKNLIDEDKEKLME